MTSNFKEEIRVTGAQLVDKVTELIHEGNVRNITITDKAGNVVLSFPLTMGVVGIVLAPTLAAVGAVAALLTECTIAVERK
jgi:VanZ family protein